MLLEISLVLLCVAQLLYVTRHVVRASRARREARHAAALVDHLDWTQPRGARRRRQRRGGFRA